MRHTRRQLVRVYPAGSRASSSNYNAVPFWNVGCQLVALNYQTDDKEKSFYLGRFRANGNCGYVLKPQWLTADGTDLDRPADRLRSYFCVRIISGQNLPKVQGKPDGVVDPYVSLEVWGHPLDFFKFKTDNVDNNGASGGGGLLIQSHLFCFGNETNTTGYLKIIVPSLHLVL